VEAQARNPGEDTKDHLFRKCPETEKERVALKKALEVAIDEATERVVYPKAQPAKWQLQSWLGQTTIAPAKTAQHSMPREGTAAATAPVPSADEDKESEMEMEVDAIDKFAATCFVDEFGD
jgi:hypothetical protein